MEINLKTLIFSYKISGKNVFSGGVFLKLAAVIFLYLSFRGTESA